MVVKWGEKEGIAPSVWLFSRVRGACEKKSEKGKIGGNTKRLWSKIYWEMKKTQKFKKPPQSTRVNKKIAYQWFLHRLLTFMILIKIVSFFWKLWRFQENFVEFLRNFSENYDKFLEIWRKVEILIIKIIF